MKVNPENMTDCQYRKMRSKKDKKRVRVVNVIFTNWMLSAEGGAMLASFGSRGGGMLIAMRCTWSRRAVAREKI